MKPIDTYKMILLILVLTFAVISDSHAEIVQADAIREAVIDTLESVASRCDLNVEVDVPAAANIFIRGLDNAAILVHEPSGDLFGTRCRVPVDFIDINGEVVRSITVSARIKRFETVAVLTVDKRRGDPIREGDYVLEERNVTSVSGYFTDSVALNGIQMKRNVKGGNVLTEGNTEPIPLVKRGEKVVLKATVGSVVIVAEGIARENGILDEYIRVYNETTRKTLEGRVIDAQTVRIDGEGG